MFSNKFTDAENKVQRVKMNKQQEQYFYSVFTLRSPSCYGLCFVFED